MCILIYINTQALKSSQLSLLHQLCGVEPPNLLNRGYIKKEKC